MPTNNYVIQVPGFGIFPLYEATSQNVKDWAKLIISRRKCGMVVIRKRGNQ